MGRKLVFYTKHSLEDVCVPVFFTQHANLLCISNGTEYFSLTTSPSDWLYIHATSFKLHAFAWDFRAFQAATQAGNPYLTVILIPSTHLESLLLSISKCWQTWMGTGKHIKRVEEAKLNSTITFLHCWESRERIRKSTKEKGIPEQFKKSWQKMGIQNGLQMETTLLQEADRVCWEASVFFSLSLLKSSPCFLYQIHYHSSLQHKLLQHEISFWVFQTLL